MPIRINGFLRERIERSCNLAIMCWITCINASKKKEKQKRNQKKKWTHNEIYIL